jgi:exopolysaccharide biosynthesis protein
VATAASNAHTEAIEARNRLTIESGVATAERAIPRPNRRRVFVIAGLVVLFALAVAASARDLIARTYLERSLSAALGGPVTIGALHGVAAGRTELEDVRMATASGATLLADRVVYGYGPNGSGETVEPVGLRVAVRLDRLHGDESARLTDALHVLGVDHLTVNLRDADVTIGRADDAATAVEITGIDGTIAAGPRPVYDLTGSLVDASGSYPIAGQAAIDGNVLRHAWTSPALPLAPLSALIASDALVVTAGVARDVAFSYDDGLRGTFRLDGVQARIAGHDVRDIGGPVTVVPDGAGSGGLGGQLPGGVAALAVGEVHDVHDWPAALAGGTRDSRALFHMFGLIASQPRLRWMNVETTAPGITFGQYAMTTLKAGTETPHVVQLLAVDPHEPTVHFDTALSSDHIISKGERTSDLGVRTHAVGGMNGDYFDIGRTYEPQGMLMRSGMLLHGPTDHEAVVIDKNNVPTFALFHLHGQATGEGRHYPITLFNSWPTREGAIITPDYGATLPAAPGDTFVALASLGGNRYRVTGVHDMATSMPVTFGLGLSDDVHQPLPRAGDVLTITYRLDPPVEGAVAGIGSGPLLVHDGQWYEDKHAPAPDERNVPWPVDAIGMLADGTLVFAAVDGRHPERSIGMSRPDFAALLRGFGVTEAMALDSGGSVTLVSRAPGNSTVTVRNQPSDDSAERYVSDALLVYSSAPLGTIVMTPHPHVEPTPGVAGTK